MNKPSSRNHPLSSISVVVPCFNEQEVIRELHKRLTGVLNNLSTSYEIILVDDGSQDRTWELMSELQNSDDRLKIIRLARNSGQQLALCCGIDQTRGEVVVILDADLQDPPELIPEMIRLWSAGYDVVYGKRSKRVGESLPKRAFAFLFYRTFRRLSGFRMPEDTGDFRLMDRRAVDALLTLRERHRFLRGMVSWIGFHQTPIIYNRPKRAAGVSKYPFIKSLALAIDGIVSFSFLPLRLASLLGGAFVCCSIIAALFLIFAASASMSVHDAWYYSVPALFIGGVQLICIGILGEYVGRTFELSQRRPLYLIDAIQGEPLRQSNAIRSVG